MTRFPPMTRVPPPPWWLADARRAELKAKWSPRMDETARELIYREILEGTDPADIVAQGVVHDEPARLVAHLKQLRRRVEYWIEQFNPYHLVSEPSPELIASYGPAGQAQAQSTAHASLGQITRLERTTPG